MSKDFEDVSYGNSERQKLDIYVNNRSDKTLIYIHGGGLVNGDKKAAQDFRDGLIKAGFSVISVNYSLYPKAKFPDYIKDVALALHFIKENGDIYGYGKNLYICGGSAGAFIAAMILFDDKYLSQYKMNSCDFKAFILDSPQPTTHFNVLKERGVESNAIRIDDASPMYFLKKHTDFPDLVLITYENDIFCRKEQNMTFSKALESYGIKHIFKIFDGKHCSGEVPDENGEIRLLSLIEKLYVNA